VSLDGTVLGKGTADNKKMASHYAALDFLKWMFPKGTTWNEAVALILTKRDKGTE